MSQNVSAPIRRWQLAERLRAYREAAGMTSEQAVAELRNGAGRWSTPKISRIENRDHNLKPAELDQLLDVYGVTDRDTREELHDLAEKANERGWWLAYRKDLPTDFHPILSLEVAMVSQRQFENTLVPGLLQVPDYTRALVSGINPHFAPDQVERVVAARMGRQQILTQEHPPELHLILEQGVLERPVGRPAVMRAQLRRLAEAAEEPNITVQILQRLTGANPGMRGPFMIVSLPEPIPDVGYVEGAGGGMYIENRAHVSDLTMRFGILTQLALPAGDSLGMINSATQSVHDE